MGPTQEDFHTTPKTSTDRPEELHRLDRPLEGTHGCPDTDANHMHDSGGSEQTSPRQAVNSACSGMGRESLCRGFDSHSCVTSAGDPHSGQRLALHRKRHLPGKSFPRYIHGARYRIVTRSEAKATTHHLERTNLRFSLFFLPYGHS